MKNWFKKNRIVLIVGCIGYLLMGTTAYAQSCYYNISQYNITFTEGGGTQVIEAELFGDDCGTVQISDDASWLSASIGFDDNITVNCSSFSGESRTGKIFISRNGSVQNTLTVTQTGCKIPWYPDTDGDSFGDRWSTAILSCTRPPQNGTIIYVSNDDDMCPSIQGTDQGCPVGQVPEDRNWVETESYGIDGTLKAAGKTYFDALGKQEQSQSLDIETDKIWASEVIYDSQGRPALQTLSAPINGSGFQYKSGFTLNGNGSPYGKNDFEPDQDNPATVATDQHTLGWYYSEQNTDAFYQGNSYQDITDRPYYRTVYSTLNPDTPLRVIGGNKINDEWPQSYTFSMPASEELSKTVAFGEAKYNGYKIIKTVSRDVHGFENVIFTDSDGKTLAASRSGGTTSRNMSVPIGAQGYVDIHVPAGNNMGFTVSAGGNAITAYDLITETTVSPATSLPNGFYRVAIDDPENYAAGSASVSYKENYYDYALNEYDSTGRLIASYQPLGDTKAAKPKTVYRYDTLGQLVYTKSPDEGEAWFKFRSDGQIRFSQNSKQRFEMGPQEFSFTEYDSFGRPIASGVKISDAFDSLLGDDPLPSGVSKEYNSTSYDERIDTRFCASASCDAIDLAGGQTNTNGNVVYTSNDQSTTYYSYDIYGRVTWILQNIVDLGYVTTHYTYDPSTGLVTHVDYQKNVPSERFVHKYGYDEVDQLTSVETSTNGTDFDLHASYEYYENGSLKRTVFGEGVDAQGMDYVYNLAGQLKSINHPSLARANDPGGDTNDLFGMQVDYHNNDYKRPLANIAPQTYGTDQLNGNIKGIRWQNKGAADQEAVYAYEYDRNNWLESADFGADGISGTGTGTPLELIDEVVTSGQQETYENPISITILPDSHFQAGSDVLVSIGGGASSAGGAYDVANITYDANGNIQTLVRKKNNTGIGVAMDDLQYIYKTIDPQDGPNQLRQVIDSAGDVAGADDIGNQTDADNYVYNMIGQMIENKSEGNIKYVYNASGLVTEVSKNNLPLVKFFYNDRNHRVRKESFNEGGSLVSTTHYVRDVSGQVLAIYLDNTIRELPIYGSGRVGIFNRTDSSTQYELTDHLGNVRAVLQRNSSTSASYTDYFPGGMAMPGRNIVGDYRYGYQGQYAEKDDETGLNAFQLRMYDSRIMRWISPDPYGQYDSPYLAMGNNWMNGVDPDGGCFKKDGSDCNLNADIGSTTTGAAGYEWTMTENGWDRSDGYGFTGTPNFSDMFMFQGMQFENSLAGKTGVGMYAGGGIAKDLLVYKRWFDNPLGRKLGFRIIITKATETTRAGKSYTSLEYLLSNNKYFRPNPTTANRNWAGSLSRAGNTLMLADTYLQFQELRASPLYGELWSQSQSRLSGFEASLINTSAGANGIFVHPRLVREKFPNPNRGFLESFQFAIDAFDKGTRASSN